MREMDPYDSDWVGIDSEDVRERDAETRKQRKHGQASRPKELSTSELSILCVTNRKHIVKFKPAWRIG